MNSKCATYRLYKGQVKQNKFESVNGSIGPAKVLPEKRKRSLAIDGVRTVEDFHLGAVRQAHLGIIEPPHLCVFVGDPFIRRYPIAMPALHHKRPWRHEIGEVTVIDDIGEIELDHVVFLGEQIAIAGVDTRVLPDPFVEIGRADGERISVQQWRNAHRGLPAVRQAVKTDTLRIYERKARQPFECALVLPDNEGEER